MSEAPTPLPVREAARRRQPLDGADAQALEGALRITERERDEARERIAELERELGEARKTQVLEDEREKTARARVSALLEKWDQDLLTYPEATDERAHYAATAIKACITELRAALDAAEPAPVEGVRLGAPFPSTFGERVAHALGMCEQPEWQSGWHVATEDELIGGIERLQAAKGDGGVVCDAAEWQRRALAAEARVEELERNIASVAALVREAHRHWDSILWPEDKRFVALLAQALEIADAT